MVIQYLLIAQQVARKVPEPTRTIILMALLGIALVGMLLIVGTMLGAHWVRRQGAFRRGPAVPADTFIPQAKPTAGYNESSRANTSDTLAGDDTLRGDDTVVS